MTSSKIFRASAAIACVSALALVNAPAAFADSASASHTDSRSVYTRTISDTTPRPGDIITYTQTFTTTSGNDYIYEWRNEIDSCLEYQPGSATLKVGDANATTLPADVVVAAAGRTTINSTDSKGYWTFNTANPHTFTLNYRVGTNCKPDQQLTSGFWYKYRTYVGNKTYAPRLFEGGPAATVKAPDIARSQVELIEVPEKAYAMEPTTLRARVSASGAPEVTIPSLVGVPVRFVSGGTTLCTANVAADGTTAACEWTPATTGRYDIRAEIDGSDQLLGSNSATKTLNVTVAPPKAPTEVTADPANAQGKTQTVISGKAEPGTSIEVLGPGGSRCVATTDAEGNFSCNLGFLPNVPGTVSVTATREGVTSEKTEISVNNPISNGNSWNSPALPNWESPGLSSPNLGELFPPIPAPGANR